MKCITIQHKEVYRQLIENGEYRSDGKHVAENLVKPYKFMQKQFGWKSTPIFLNPIGYKVEFAGANFSPDSVAIELDIPDELVKVQEYYNWTDFIYFVEDPEEFQDSFNQCYRTVYDWGKLIIDSGFEADHSGPYQCCVEYVKKDWIVGTLTNISKLNKLHNNSGGNGHLKELSKYK